jgi:hypothetical protein
MKQLNEKFTDAEFRALQRVKGSRTWHEAIIEEFGIEVETDE